MALPLIAGGALLASRLLPIAARAIPAATRFATTIPNRSQVLGTAAKTVKVGAPAAAGAGYLANQMLPTNPRQQYGSDQFIGPQQQPQNQTTDTTLPPGGNNNIPGTSGDLDLIEQEFNAFVAKLDEQRDIAINEAETFKRRADAQFAPAEQALRAQKEQNLAGLQAQRDETSRQEQSAIQKTANNLQESMGALRSQLGTIGATSSSAFQGLGEKIFAQALETTGNVREAANRTYREITTRQAAAQDFFASKVTELQQNIAKVKSDIDLALQRELANLRADRRMLDVDKQAARMQIFQQYNAAQAALANQASQNHALLAQAQAKIQAQITEANQWFLKNFEDVTKNLENYAQRTGQPINLPPGTLAPAQTFTLSFSGKPKQEEQGYLRKLLPW